MNKQKLVSVYGTLRQGNGNHRLLANAEYKGTFTSQPVFNLFGKRCGFPKLKNGGNTPVVMEVYAVNDREAANVDALEGYTEGEVPTFYDKQPIETPWGTAGVYIYVGEPSPNTLIETGDWMNQEIEVVV